jgi:hypothetical protein
LMFASKGCVSRCSFCQRFCKGYKTMSLAGMEEHIRMLRDRFGISLVKMYDECFGADQRHTEKVLDIFRRNDVLWYTLIRVASASKENIIKFKESGCACLRFGIESGSQKMLTIMDKGSTVQQNHAALRDCFDQDILSIPSMLLGMPGETDETVKESGWFLGEFCRYAGVSPLEVGCAFYFATPYPGTPLYEYGLLNNCFGGSLEEEERFLDFISEREKNLSKFNFINLTGLDEKTVFFWDYLLMLEALRSFYSGPVRGVAHGFQWDAGAGHEDVFKRVFRMLPGWFNRVVFTRIPRWFLYPILRGFVYVLFMRRIQMFRLRNKPGVLTEVMPLRKINDKLREGNVPVSVTQRNQLLLYKC